MVDRDPFYRQILERLRGELNPGTFEDAVCDLLRDSFPTLVPIRGGSDGGRDGAIADGEGEAYPLLCTTAKDVLRNLHHSLDSYLNSGGQRCKVVIATSQELTPRKRSNLERRAREKGFELIQIVEQRGLADRFYRNPRWYRALGLVGAPAALSAIPHSKRPLLELSPVGRAKDLRWLRETRGDRILSGQPGSGKTFLIQSLISEGWPGLFLISQDATEIANALRAQKQGFVVIVDDAHVDPEGLVRLRRLRQEIGAQFDILATTWEGSLASVQESLGSALPVHRLELLTSRQILKIYREAGISEDNTDRILLSQLVEQAANKPGLAVTLAHLWTLAWKEVLLGRSLSRHLLETFRTLLGTDAAPLLAAISLGGDRGMSLSAVAKFFGHSLDQIWRHTVVLSHGGALFPIEGEVLAVRPRQFRSALISEVFFGRVPLPFRELIQQSVSLSSAVDALAQARIFGAPVPDAEIRELIVRTSPGKPWQQAEWERAWQWFAVSSEDNALWALDNFPGDSLALAPIILEKAPQQILTRLLHRLPEFAAAGKSEAEGSPLQLLKAWIQDSFDLPEQSIFYRTLLAEAIVDYWRQGGDSTLGLQAASLSLMAKLQRVAPDPVLGQSLRIESGLFPLPCLRELPAIWKKIVTALPELNPSGWNHLLEVFWQWIEPARPRLRQQHSEIEIPEEEIQLLRSLATTALQDLAPRVRTSPGLTAELLRFADRLGIELDLKRDAVFEVLFPGPASAFKEPGADALEELAQAWSHDSPLTVAARLSRYEKDAQVLGRWSRGSRLLCQRLAKLVTNPEVWLDAWRAEDLRPELAAPILLELVRQRPAGWVETVQTALNFRKWRGVLSTWLAGVADLPPTLEEFILAQLTSEPELTRVAFQQDLPLAVIRALLHSSNRQAALTAAISIWWMAQPRGTVASELFSDWQAVLTKAGLPEDSFARHPLAVILRNDADLAFAWLRSLLHTEKTLPRISPSSPRDEPLGAALEVLKPSQRKQILEELRPTTAGIDNFLPYLIQQDVSLYRDLLVRRDLYEYHLKPLGGLPDDSWSLLAQAATQEGWSAEEIAKASVRDAPKTHLYWGPGVDYWTSWNEAFAALASDSREPIRAIGIAGQGIIAPHLQEARERHQQILDDES